ncbi:MAG: flagellar motor stator protein MotA [Syntrophales bacterium]|jgi:chemotaxis protein MotA|nr:flagellar motor stator protein MotA [Syntrophales bacterium]MCU0554673.1 flagellar motor stator protein MotA [Syntrophales bacterium]MCU0584022.1 flagellar motor stator protein MotA [Syntrophales bacterium]
MFTIIGSVIVIACVIGGFLLEHGNLAVLFQPVELLIIGGAAVGGFIIASPMKVIKAVMGGIVKMLSGKGYTKADYLESLTMLGEVFYKIRKEGLVSVEGDVDNPKESVIFTKYPTFFKNHHALDLVVDTLRTVMTTKIEPNELEALIDAELESHQEELTAPSKSVATVADSLPGLGIVAAVLGIVLTMGKISEPPDVLGKSIGAALVGTFLGVLLCYGFVGPMAKNMEHSASEELQYLSVLKMAIVAFVGGAAPQVAVEFGRRVVPAVDKPTFAEVEEALRRIKK